MHSAAARPGRAAATDALRAAARSREGRRGKKGRAAGALGCGGVCLGKEG